MIIVIQKISIIVIQTDLGRFNLKISNGVKPKGDF